MTRFFYVKILLMTINTTRRVLKQASIVVKLFGLKAYLSLNVVVLLKVIFVTLRKLSQHITLIDLLSHIRE